MALGRVDPGPHLWEASASTTAPPIPGRHRHSDHVAVSKQQDDFSSGWNSFLGLETNIVNVMSSKNFLNRDDSYIHPYIYREQGRRGGDSARLPPMCPGFHSRTRRNMWVEFFVGSRPCSEGISSGSQVFLPTQKSTLLNFNSIWK